MNILQSHRRKNEFILREFHGNDPDIEYRMVCREAIRGPYYSGENYSLHKSCAELPGEIQHALHPEHPLRIHFSFNRSYDLICDGCRTFSIAWKYSCKNCNVNLDYQCISKYVEGQALKERVEKITNYHQHKLQLLYFPFELLQALDDDDDETLVFCICCLKGIEDSAYACLKCFFSIHESCLDTIPKQVKSLFHPQHSLLPSIVPSTESEHCDACGRVVRGIELRCPICNNSFHVSCGKYNRPGIRLQHHKHKLNYFDCQNGWGWDSVCNICHQGCEGPIYRCIECHINFHVECLVPPVLSHECHDHELTLTSSVVPRGNASKYRCDVCEEEEDFEHYVYHCEECYFMAHIECLFFEEDNPPLVDSELQIDEVEEAAIEDDQEAQESDVEDEESEKSSNKETDESEIDTEQESDLEDYSLSKLNQKIIHVTTVVDNLTIKLNLLKEKYAKKLRSQS